MIVAGFCNKSKCIFRKASNNVKINLLCNQKTILEKVIPVVNGTKHQ